MPPLPVKAPLRDTTLGDNPWIWLEKREAVTRANGASKELWLESVHQPFVPTHSCRAKPVFVPRASDADRRFETARRRLAKVA